eukprot:m.109819 g.109819  ORF g.109819 m.109819 type:complete len:413 (+) comp21285_c0_seq1:60-1298(+)
MADSSGAMAASPSRKAPSNAPYYTTCSCECGARMLLAAYKPGTHNPRGYENGWQCDREDCTYDSRTCSESPRSQLKFSCEVEGCESDLCNLCGRMKIPVFERRGVRAERTFPATFELGNLETSITPIGATTTGTGTFYAVQVLEASGQTWTLSKRYSEFEKLHIALEGVLWTADAPADPPFPPKEVFPSVARRADRLGKYLAAACSKLSDMPEQTQVVVVRFLCSAYRPVSSDPRVPLMPLDAAAPQPTPPSDDETPSVGTRAVDIPMSSALQRRCLQCPDILQHVEYVPGSHNPEGYKTGWQCDKCAFLSVEEPRSQRARFRYHCGNCNLDFCVTCFGSMQTPSADKIRLMLAPHGRPSPLSTQSISSTNSPSVLRLREAKALLDEGLISIDDYDELKTSVLSNLVNAPIA